MNMETTKNNITKTIELVDELLINNQYINLKLYDWFFKGFNNSKIDKGGCTIEKNLLGTVKEKYIIFSKPLFNVLDWDDCKDTILHEISHAIDYEYKGYMNHDDTWKLIHINLGGTGNAEYMQNEKTLTLTNYIGQCHNCGYKNGWIRKPKYINNNFTYLCPNCKKGFIKNIKKVN